MSEKRRPKFGSKKIGSLQINNLKWMSQLRELGIATPEGKIAKGCGSILRTQLSTYHPVGAFKLMHAYLALIPVSVPEGQDDNSINAAGWERAHFGRSSARRSSAVRPGYPRISQRLK
jgi:hypothetical protein